MVLEISPVGNFTAKPFTTDAIIQNRCRSTLVHHGRNPTNSRTASARYGNRTARYGSHRTLRETHQMFSNTCFFPDGPCTLREPRITLLEPPQAMGTTPDVFETFFPWAAPARYGSRTARYGSHRTLREPHQMLAKSSPDSSRALREPHRTLREPSVECHHMCIFRIDMGANYFSICSHANDKQLTK